MERVLAFVLLLVVASVATLAIGLGLGAISGADLLAVAALVRRLAMESEILPRIVRLFVALSGGLGLVLAVLLMWRVAKPPGGSSVAPYLVNQDTFGTVTVLPGALTTVAQVVARSFRGFQALDCQTEQNESGDVVVRCRLRMHPDARLAADAASFRERLRAELEDRTGLQVSLVDVEMSYGSPSTRRRVS